MEKEMQLRLNQAKERLKDIDLKLEDPDVVKDLDAFRKLSKEKANLDPIIEKYDEYLKLVSDREDALLMLKDSDEEIIMNFSFGGQSSNQLPQLDFCANLEKTASLAIII